ncbi:unnamed protein product, partial [Rotaria sp. Silwood1]
MCSLIEKQVFTISDKLMIDATRFAFERLKLVIELAANYHNNDSHIDLFYFRRQNMNENASSATTTNISR